MTGTINRRQMIGGTAAALGLTAAGVAAARPASAANWKILPHEHQWQETGYWCGPAATRAALSCKGIHLSQQDLANQLGTHEGGTDDISQVTSVLNNHLDGYYESKYIPNDPPTQAQKDLLWDDLVTDIDNGYGLVANIWAPASNHPPGYPDEMIQHYFAVVGYNPDTRQAYIVDSAEFSQGQYWLSFDQLASLVPPKGYAA